MASLLTIAIVICFWPHGTICIPDDAAFILQERIPEQQVSFMSPNRVVYEYTHQVSLCVYGCLLHGDKCVSFNYQHYLAICELIPERITHESQLDIRLGYEYGERSEYDIDESRLTPCTAVPCNNGGVCTVDYEHNTFMCYCIVGSRFIGPTCNTPVTDGMWVSWESWSDCSVSCNAGYQTRTRKCEGRGDGGDDCDGASIEYRKCETQLCPLWSMWQDAPCSPNQDGITNMHGTRTRQRTCLRGGEPNVDEGCMGETQETIDCHVRYYDSLRLGGSPELGQGRVEVYREEAGSWGTICGDQWTIENTDVVCRELGFGKGLPPEGVAIASESTLPILMTDVVCKGSEPSLAYCFHGDAVDALDCTHKQDVLVFCAMVVGVNGRRGVIIP
ncbi:uncharacterized protein LOC144344183 [Saccoglossus kowalevskii]